MQGESSVPLRYLLLKNGIVRSGFFTITALVTDFQGRFSIRETPLKLLFHDGCGNPTATKKTHFRCCWLKQTASENVFTSAETEPPLKISFKLFKFPAIFEILFSHQISEPIAKNDKVNIQIN